MILVVAGKAATLAGLVGAEHHAVSTDQVGEEALGSRILLADPVSAAGLIHQMPRLEWVQSTWAGVEPILAAGVPEGVTLTSMKIVFGPQMREFVFGHLLAHTQRVVARTTTKTWDERPPSALEGRRMGILGAGSIGSALAETAHHFGMEVVGCSRSGRPVLGFDRMFAVEDRLVFARRLDHLVAVLPATRYTADLVDRELLDVLNPGATLVNVGRGATVDTEAVVSALSSGRLSLAVLDVLPTEPLPDDSPLWRVPGLVITSHTAAHSRPEDVARLFLANLGHYRAGEKLIGVVDVAAGY